LFVCFNHLFVFSCTQSLIGLRAAMSLALPARRCYKSSRDWCHQTIQDTILMSRFNIVFLRTTCHSRRMRMLVFFSPTKLTHQKPNRDQAQNAYILGLTS
jgi:hypothetical protein